MTIEQLKESAEYYLHHTAKRVGYESRKGNGHIEEYNGKFGTGYVLITPRYDTTRYTNISYYIKKEEQA